MTEEQANLIAKAAAFQIAAALGVERAKKIMQTAANSVECDMWTGPGNR